MILTYTLCRIFATCLPRLFTETVFQFYKSIVVIGDLVIDDSIVVRP